VAKEESILARKKYSRDEKKKKYHPEYEPQRGRQIISRIEEETTTSVLITKHHTVP